jgi:polysaccharide export outer membrane protein
MKKIYLLAVFVSALLMQTVVAQDIVNTSGPADKKVRGYLVGPGDKIEAKVLGEDQFAFAAFVDENGNFNVPFDTEPISAKCRTENELRAEVTKRIAKYVRNPMVSVFVSERRKPIPVTVYGEVRSPQQVELRREARLMELIAVSGGVKEEAGGIVWVFRPQLPVCAETEMADNWRKESKNGLEVPSRMYSLSGIRKGMNESNPIVYPGDLILVEKASPVYINGEINNRNGVYIKEGGLSLTQALAMAGGLREEAQIKDVKIYRRRPNSPERDVISANLLLIKTKEAKDIMLEPYDIIDVSKKKKSIGKLIFEAVVGGARSGAISLATGGANRILY